MREYRDNFVAPLAPQRPAPQMPMLIDAEPIRIESALQAQEGAQERTSATDRAVGLAIRIAPFSAVWAVLAIGSVWAIGAAWWAGFLLFSGLTFLSYAWLDSQDWRHSRAGVERLKINRAYQLKKIELESQAETRRAAMETYRQLLLEGKDNGR